MSKLKCDGGCNYDESCERDARPVVVRGSIGVKKIRWSFNYCDVAIETDIANGFEVTELARTDDGELDATEGRR